MGDSQQEDRLAIDELARAFFAAFTNKDGRPPRVDSLYDLFIPDGIIVKAVAAVPEVYSVHAFVEPREQLLRDGTLLDFEEAEVSGRTDIIGNIAQRFCIYRKSGVLSGQRFATRGVKVLQFVKTPAGWRLSAVAWDDEREGLVVPD